MRVQCDVCETALAQVVCCADEAALCLACDQRVHAANKLASKHHRLRLLHNDNTAPLPLCDICQEKAAFIFCLEDRALLCRNCDVSIHAPNTLAAGHRRFLATGVQVALESEQQAGSLSTSLPQGKPHPRSPAISGRQDASTTTTSNPVLLSPSNKFNQRHADACSTELQDDLQNSFKHLEEWRNSQGLNLPDLASGYALTDIELSKNDLALSDQDWMVDLGVFENNVNGTDSLGEVPQSLFSMSTGIAPVGRIEASCKGKLRQDVVLVPDFDDVSVVPDLILFTDEGPPLKRQKNVIRN